MVRVAVRHFFVKHSPEPCRIVAAVSGGVDSTALLLALAPLRDEGFDLIAAHVNHHLRGAESDADEAFVRELCIRLGVALHVADGTVEPDAVRARGVEAAAREVRYARLLAFRDASGARFVATAHQQDDQAETLVMRLVTGGGLPGLRGIHPKRDDGVVRPLLEVTRAEIDAFLKAEGVTPRHDCSNDDPRFLRNRVRAVLSLLPRDTYLPLAERLTRLAEEARRLWQFREAVLDAAERTVVEAGPDETRFLRLPEERWLRKALLLRHIRRLDPAARDVSDADLARLAAKLPLIQRTSVTKRLELLPRDGAIVLARRAHSVAEPPFELRVAPGGAACIPSLGVTVRLASEPGGSRGQRIQVPAGIPPLFTVRNRRPGDRFQPLGMHNSKKLKDFLIDRKIAAGLRDRLPLLLCNDEIVWVAGVAVSERFKVTDPPAGVSYQVWLEDSGGSGERDQSPLQR